MGKYKNVDNIKPDSLIPVSNPKPAFDLDDTNPEPASDFDDIYDSDDDEESVFLTPPFLPKYHTSISPANKDEDKDIKISFLSELNRPKQSTAKPTN